MLKSIVPGLLSRAPLLLALLLSLLALWFAWLLVDRLAFSSFNLGLQPQSVQPLRDTSRLAWFRAEGETAAPVTVVSGSEDDEFQDASANAQLLGVLIGEGDLAFAAIQTPQVADGVYAVGQEILPNLVLLRVEPNRVVVRERGAERQIRLKPLSDAAQTSDSELIESVPRDTTSGFSLSGVMGATPVSVAGEGIGLRLDALDSEVAAMSGLQSGDIVLAVGGRPVAQLMASPAAFTQMSNETALLVRVRRGEQDMELTVNARSMRERILPEIGQGMVQ